MKVSFTQPQSQLAPYVDLFWVFESSAGIPMSDSRIIVPDGKPRILIPYKNSLSVIMDGSPIDVQQQQIFLTGIQTNPRTIGSSTAATGTIGIQLTPKGLYHFFRLSFHEITDHIYSFDQLFGRWGAGLQNQLADIDTPLEKIAFLQKALTEQLIGNNNNYTLLDRTMDLITQSHGLIRIRDLAAQTGYSKRYLDLLFKQHVGVSPKSLANILRFQSFYQAWIQQGSSTFSKDNLYAFYYDQAHFIKEFKRFTGFTPQSYADLITVFSRSFYHL